MGKGLCAKMGMWMAVMLLAGAGAMAQSSHPVAGKYAVTASSPELGEIKFQIMLEQDGEKWKGSIKDSPMPFQVSSVTVDAENQVTITSDVEGTPVVIAGKFDAGKITGEWKAGDMAGKWLAIQEAAEAPATDAPAAAASSAPAAGSLEGTYQTTIVADGQGEFSFSMVIANQDGTLKTSVPEGGDLNIVEIEVKDPDVVNLTATYQGQGPIPLTGKRVGTDEMAGKWEAGGFSGTWKAVRKK
ncbi:MAG: hypothetical protein ACO394_05725 [Blastocatellia bacterium]